jgi:predicted Zn-dependent protease
MKNILLSLFFLFSGLFFTGCSDSSSNPLDFNLFTVEDDLKLGTDLDAQIRSNPNEYPLYTDTSANAYVQGIVNEIIKSSLIQYKNVFPYKVQLIRDNNTVNAFAIPGGYIYVYTGLCKFVDNEATLAAVLAHEIGHAEARHSTKRMTKQYGLELLLQIVLGNNPSELEKLGGNLLTGLTLLKNSRDDEYEADELSFRYLQTSMWYAGAIKYFFDKIKTDDTADFLKTLLLTHPLPEDRIEAVNKLINDANLPLPSESNLFSTRYTQFKNSLPG